MFSFLEPLRRPPSSWTLGWLGSGLTLYQRPGIHHLPVLDMPEKMVCETPIFKTTRTKWTGGVVQAVECLFTSSKT
jgi:hypothetical protein